MPIEREEGRNSFWWTCQSFTPNKSNKFCYIDRIMSPARKIIIKTTETYSPYEL